MTKSENRNNYRISKHAISFKGTTSRTKQSFAEECDINNIVRRARQDGVLTHINPNQQRVADNFNALDYTQSMNIIAQATQDFEQLPAIVRDRFNNDPKRYLEFMDRNDEIANKEKIKLGLAKERATPTEPEPQKVFVVNVNEPNEHETNETTSGKPGKGAKKP